MVHFLLIILLALISYPAMAEDIPVECRLIEKHKPADNVAYQPGVDAYGNAVVPADLNAQTINVADVTKVPLSINLAERLNTMIEGTDLEAPLGMLEISQDGSVKYNGEDWSAPIATICGHSHKVVETPKKPRQAEPQEPVEDRLEEQDVIKSVEPIKEVEPVVAVPPQEVNIEQLNVEPEIDSSEKNEVIEGGEYREIFFNE